MSRLSFDKMESFYGKTDSYAQERTLSALDEGEGLEARNHKNPFSKVL